MLFFLLDAFQELRDAVVKFEARVPKPFRLRVDALPSSAVILFHAAFYAVQDMCKGVSCVEFLMDGVRFQDLHGLFHGGSVRFWFMESGSQPLEEILFRFFHRVGFVFLYDLPGNMRLLDDGVLAFDK